MVPFFIPSRTFCDPLSKPKLIRSQPALFIAASSGRLVPNPGGVLIRDAGNRILGAVGISGDTGDNDEIIAVAGIEAAGLKADPGGMKK